jgi:predicted transcriptional regulator
MVTGVTAMTTMTIYLSDERLNKLKQLAVKANVQPDELVQSSVDEWLSGPDEEFKRAVNYLLQKNAELYTRLAR